MFVRLLSAAILTATIFCATAFPQQGYQWTGSTSTDWFTGSNWSPNGVPGTSDTATFVNGSASISADIEVAALHVKHVSVLLSGTGNITVADSMYWSDGTISGSYGGTLTIVNGAALDGPGNGVVLSKRTLINNGTMRLNSAEWQMRDSATLINNGTWIFEGTSSDINRGDDTPLRITNNGLVQIAVGSNEWMRSYPAFDLSGSGMVEVQSGKLQLLGGGTHLSGSSMTVAATTRLRLGGGHTFNGGSSISGAGVVEFTTGGPSTMSGTYNVTGMTIMNGEGSYEVLFNGTLVNMGDSVSLQGNKTLLDVPGPITFSRLFVGAWTVNGPAHRALWSPANITITNHIELSDGGVEGPLGSTLTIDSGATLKSTGNYVGLTKRTFINNGTMTLNSAEWQMRDSATLINNGTWICEGTSSDINKGDNTPLRITNNGLMEITVGTNESMRIFPAFDLSGSGMVDVQSGKLQLLGGGTHLSGSSMSVAAGTRLRLGGGHTFNPGSSVAGTGAVEFTTGGPSTVSGTYNVTGMTIMNGEGSYEVLFNGTLVNMGDSVSLQGNKTLLDVPGPITFSRLFVGAWTVNGPAHRALWSPANITITNHIELSDGGVEGPLGSTLTIDSGATLKSTGNYVGLTKRTFINNGTMTLNSAEWQMRDSATLINNGTWICEGTSSDINKGDNTPLRITNNGLMEITVGTNESMRIFPAFDLSGSGMVEVQSGKLQLLGGGTHLSGSSMTVAATTRLRLGGGHTFNGGSSISGAGVVEFTTGGPSTVSGTYNVTGMTIMNGEGSYEVLFNGTLVNMGDSVSLQGNKTVLDVPGPISFSRLFVGAWTVNGPAHRALWSPANITITNHIELSDGGVEGPLGSTLTIDSGATLKSTGNYVGLTKRTFINNGTMTLNGADWRMRDSATLINNGLWTCEGDESYIAKSDDTPLSVVNTGSLEVSGNSSVAMRIDVPFHSVEGSITVGSRKFSLDEGGTLSNQIQFMNGGILELNQGAFQLEGTTTVSGVGHLFLNQNVTSDTLVILSSNPSALSGNGKILGGTITRAIHPDSIAPYRFESIQSTLAFDGSADLPFSVTVTYLPDSSAADALYDWTEMASTVDVNGNLISATNISPPGKWAIGTSAGSDPAVAAVGLRLITVEGNGIGNATIVVPYDQSDLLSGVQEDSLILLVEPYAKALTLDASPIGLYDAELRSIVNLVGDSSETWFEWGTDTLYGNVTEPELVPGGQSSFVFTQTISGLTESSTYHYRAITSDEIGISTGEDVQFTTLASKSEYVSEASTLALYHFNEENGSFVQDYSGNGFHGIATGTGRTEGKYGRALGFYESESSVEIPALSWPSQSSFTLEAWVLPSLQEITGEFSIISKGSSNNSSESFSLRVLDTGEILFILNPTGLAEDQYSVETFDAPVTDSVWSHLAAVVDFSLGSIRLYYNGENLETVESGEFPASVFFSERPVVIGSSDTGSLPEDPVVLCWIDEIRISAGTRAPGEFRVFEGGSISGMKFHDLDADGERDPGEPGLGGWSIVLQKEGFASSSKYDTTVTDDAGNYVFGGLANGYYVVQEIQQDGWIHTYPRAPWKHKVPIVDSIRVTDRDFGNKLSCIYIGPPGGSWHSPEHWSCGHAPNSQVPISIPNNSTVIVDSLPSDSINAIRVQSGGHLSFSNVNQLLHVTGAVQIDGDGTLSFSGEDDSSGLVVYDDWYNAGAMNPGRSTVIFAGSGPKLIVSDTAAAGGLFKSGIARADAGGNRFYNLVIEGDSTSAAGNITVENTLSLVSSLTQRPQDTVFILNDAAEAVEYSGEIIRGSIQRAIGEDVTATYGFGSRASHLQFSTAGISPSAVTVTTSPFDSQDRAFGLYWQVVPSSVDPDSNMLRAENVTRFSKWTLGKPGPGVNRRSVAKTRINASVAPFDSLVAADFVQRVYTISPLGGSEFSASVQLSYGEAELNGIPENDLTLLRGPFVVNSIRSGWNMISTPVDPETRNAAALFPMTLSPAFGFDPDLGYVESSSLTPGAGYWMKFALDETLAIEGTDYDSLLLDLTEGWNMIGWISYPMPAASVQTDPPGILESSFYEYSGGYRFADTLDPMRAYWVKSSSAGKLLVAFEWESRAKVVTQSPGTDLHTLTIHDGTDFQQTLYFGRGKSSSSPAMPPRPPVGAPDARFSSDRIVERSMTSDAIGIVTQSLRYPIRLSWNISADTCLRGNEAYELIVDGSAFAMSGSVSVTIDQPPVSLFLRINLEGRTLPKEFALHQNYPNPFNPSTSFSFDLPMQSVVSVIIFNILGQEVSIPIASKVYEAGSHTVVFDGANIASGVYFYQLTARSIKEGQSTFSATRKMVVVR